MNYQIGTRTFFIISFLVMFSFCTIFGFLGTKITVSSIRQQFLDSLDARSKIFVDSISEAILRGDYPQVIQKSQSFLETDDVLAVNVALADGYDIFQNEDSSSDEAYTSALEVVNKAPWDQDSKQSSYATVSVKYGVSSEWNRSRQGVTYLLVLLSLMFLILLFISYLFNNAFVRPLRRVDELLRDGDLERMAKANETSSITEISRLSRSINQMASKVTAAEDKQRELAIHEAVLSTARRVAHDIRSPLSALQVLARVSHEMPEKKKRVLIAAADRISGIANDLLTKSKMGVQTQISESKMIDVLCCSLIEEKRLELNGKAILEVDSAYGCFANVDGSRFCSILSNLINNSVEAGAEKIIVSVKSNDFVTVEISDDGCGISPDVLKRLGNQEITTKSNGNGIGLLTAYESVRIWGGEIRIKSSEHTGTQILIILKAEAPPKWFIPKNID